VPSRTSVQRWMAKLGYFKLHAPLEKASDWIILIDESIQIGSQKYLVILGYRAKNIPRGHYLKLNDLIPLHAVVQTKNDAESIEKALESVRLRVGNIMGICSDEGSNLLNGVRMYQEKHKTIHISDIVHKLANIIKKELNVDPEWDAFIKSVNSTKQKIYNTSFSHLAPPALRGKSRFLNLDVLLGWASDKLDLLKNGSTSAEYDAEAAELYLGWLRQFEEPLKYYTNLLEITCIARHLVREKGIQWYIADDFAIEFENSSPSKGWDTASVRVAAQVYDFLEEQSKKVGQSQVLLGSSEVIETFFGKFKSIQGSNKTGFSGLVLAGLAHIGNLDKVTVQAAIETVTHAQVDDWIKRNVGKSVHAKRCGLIEKSTKQIAVMFHNLSIKIGQVLTGSLEGEPMGF
jgi:hypothetical protein